MVNCKKCGKRIMTKAPKFCPDCGAAMGEEDSSNQRRQVFEGTVHKCPSCGEILNTFELICPSCGYELRNTKVTSAVKELTDKLQQIDAGAGSITNGIRNIVKGEAFIGNYTRKASLIKSFAIPNNKGDIMEFLILATSNIDPECYNMLNIYKGANIKQLRKERIVSDAWISKGEQAVQKAKLSFSGDSDFSGAIEEYENKISEVKKSKYKLLILFGVFFGLTLLMVIIGTIMGY